MYVAKVLKYLKKKLTRIKENDAFVVGSFETVPPQKFREQADKRGQVGYRRSEPSKGTLIN